MAEGLKNLAAILYGKRDIRLENIPIPQPDSQEVQIQVQKVGICGSDVHLWQDGGIGDFFTLPIILGHECTGVVSKTGPGVSRVKTGDRVCLEPLRSCRGCRACVSGRPNVCPNNVVFYAQSPHNGAMCRYLKIHEDYVHKLPDSVSFEEAVLMEPLAVAFRACQRAGVRPGDALLICGAGPIGLSVLAVARTLGATNVIITDVLAARLETVGKMGATRTMLVQASDRPDVTARLVEEALGSQPDKALECSGAESALDLCIHALKTNGVLALVGIGDEYLRLPVQKLVTKELEVVGSLCYVNMFDEAVKMVADGTINVRPLLSDVFPLQETEAAFKMAESRKGMKIIVDCSL